MMVQWHGKGMESACRVARKCNEKNCGRGKLQEGKEGWGGIHPVSRNVERKSGGERRIGSLERLRGGNDFEMRI